MLVSVSSTRLTEVSSDYLLFQVLRSNCAAPAAAPSDGHLRAEQRDEAWYSPGTRPPDEALYSGLNESNQAPSISGPRDWPFDL